MNGPPPPLPDILDVEPPMDIPPPPSPWGWWVGAGVALVSLVVLIWCLLRRRPVVVETPKERALKRLATLKSQVSQMDGYQFGVAVSDILRNYLTQAHDLRASQQTSREFLEELKREERFSEKRQERLRQFLQTCDFLKYAPAGRATQPNRDLLEHADFFIREDTD